MDPSRQALRYALQLCSRWNLTFLSVSIDVGRDRAGDMKLVRVWIGRLCLLEMQHLAGAHLIVLLIPIDIFRVSYLQEEMMTHVGIKIVVAGLDLIILRYSLVSLHSRIRGFVRVLDPLLLATLELPKAMIDEIPHSQKTNTLFRYHFTRDWIFVCGSRRHVSMERM